MHTPKTYVNTIRIKIVATLTILLAASSVAYYLAEHCRTKMQFIVLSAVYLFIWLSCVGSFWSKFKELRRWKKIATMFVTMFLCFTFCPQPAQGMIALPPGTTWNQFTNTTVAEPPPQPVNGQPQPKVALCEVVVGMIVIGVGAWIGYSIYKCAKKAFNPPTNCPPTNADGIPRAGAPVREGKSAPVVQPTLIADTSGIGWDNTVITNGWLDWTGNMVIGSFGGYITNSFYTNSDGSTTSMTFQSSPDLQKWTPEYVYVMGWVSQTAYSTNVTAIIYDQYGTPFSTNWYSTQPLARNGVPIRTNSAMFYRINQ